MIDVHTLTEHELEIIRLNERVQDLEGLLEYERDMRGEAERRATALLDGALDRQELADGYSGQALLEANRRVRAILSPAIDGAGDMTTVGIAKAVAARAMIGRGPAPEVNGMAALTIRLAIRPLYDLAAGASPELRAGLSHCAAALAHHLAQR